MNGLLQALPLLSIAQAQAAEQASAGIPWFVTVPVFILMLVLLVFVHELGHFLMALWMGIRVEEFGIGFPPRAVTLFRHRGVDYTLNWVPLGGFVRFAGDADIYSGAQKKPLLEDVPSAHNIKEGEVSAQNTGNTRDAHDDEHQGGMTLAEAPPWRKIPVMFAGPFANFLAAVIIFTVIAWTTGITAPTGKGQRVMEVLPDMPAAAAGFQSGDIIVSLDGQSVVEDTNSIKSIAEQNENTPIEATILRDGEEMTLTITPELRSFAGSEQVMLGFRYGADVEVNRTNNPLVAIGSGLEHTWRVLETMAYGLGQMVGGLFGANEPPPGGVAGPVGIARATGEVIDAGGFLGFWNWMAIISLNLFLLNLLPIPALDGSHIVFALIEWVRGGKKIPPEKEAMVHAIGFATLLGLIAIVSINDVWNAIQGTPVIPGQ
jgi:regulator of sigma E protease